MPAASASTTSVPSPGDLLTLLMTAEGLLFAALAIGVSLQALGEGNYLPKFIKKGQLSGWIFVVITGVAIGAASAWYDVFGDTFKHSDAGALMQSLALAAAIAAQPILGLVIWRGSAD
jgi:hypothetical protein